MADSLGAELTERLLSTLVLDCLRLNLLRLNLLRLVLLEAEASLPKAELTPYHQVCTSLAEISSIPPGRPVYH